MYTKVLITFALAALTLSTTANPIAVRRSNLRAISTILERRAEANSVSESAPPADAAPANPLGSMLGALDPISAASELISDSGSALEAGASEMAMLMGIAPQSDDASNTGDSSNDLPANLPIKRDNLKREPLGFEDLIGGGGSKGKADDAATGEDDAAAGADADADPLSAITGLLGGAGGAGGAAGDLLANLPIKRDNFKREPISGLFLMA
ncbi:hypothetical protein OnM2_067037 [Erysiphe neolycopersici]|uniref:Uncharacterized protein n=1 Tax=Erysiphe neolycopersici TaxID=212602 RepID=A0A420HM13_9PEZI|nr:hypothetical protein OnM2_067037 [Erysiphe neolycopersici]